MSEEQRKSILIKYGVSEKFLLFVGTVEPRKNLDFMLELMPGLAQAGFSLLVVGAKGWGRNRIVTTLQRDGFPTDRVIMAGYVPSEDLVKLYNMAAVYVSTSLNEGFGLPQLEEMHCGCPVVSPHNSAMIEVVAGAGRTVEGWVIGTWQNAILEVYDQRDKYRDLGFMRAVYYKWSAHARRISLALSS